MASSNFPLQIVQYFMRVWFRSAVSLTYEREARRVREMFKNAAVAGAGGGHLDLTDGSCLRLDECRTDHPNRQIASEMRNHRRLQSVFAIQITESDPRDAVEQERSNYHQRRDGHEQ